jgi:RecA/RadA recombinase
MAKSMRERMLSASKNPNAGFFDDDNYGKIRDYIDTGSIILNAQISSFPRKGIPSGRVIQMAGPESSGKTFVCLETVKNAQKDGYFIIYYDSEAANDAASMGDRGLDLSQLMYVPVATVEELTTSILNILDDLSKDDRVMIVIDSLGNLSSTKELEDATDGKGTRDMTRAQKLKALFRTVTVKAGVLNVPIMAVNHVYATIGSFFGGNTVAGGSGPAYANSCTLELTKAQYKQGEDVIGGIFTSKATKNRLAREKTKVKFKISFDKGMARYSGLDIAAETSKWLILPERARSYRVNIGGIIPDECKGKTADAKTAYKAWLETLPQVSKKIVEEGTDTEFWEDFLNQGFEEVLTEMFRYGDADFVLDLSGETPEDL